MVDIIDELVNRIVASPENFARTMEACRQIEAIVAGFDQAIFALQVSRQRRSKVYSQLLAEVPAMTRRSWFISGYFGLSEIVELARICGTVTPAILDSRVADMYRTNLADHGESLSRDYPTRIFAIQPAIAAHERKEYVLSVPIFFAQAEGIYHDRTQKYIFRKEKGKHIYDDAKKELATFADKIGIDPDDALSQFMKIMWTSYASALPIGYSEADRRKHRYTGLNRPLVMHGIALDYATEENSLKAFSLLSHVGSLVA